jgi:chemotaxis protein CheD
MHILVKIGEVKKGHDQDVLKATLGSCVGIAFIRRDTGMAALAHCLLPSGPSTFSIGAKYVTQAIPSLISVLNLNPEDYEHVEAHLAGGANMFNVKGEQLQNVGKKNAELAVSLVKELGIKIISKHFGGTSAYQMTINCSNGTVQVNNIISSRVQDE